MREKLNERAGHRELGELVAAQLPIQRRDLRDAMEASIELAAKEDPDETG